ncbi:MAG: anti-sigma factor antagonist [Tildeniella nuda ZEHNDER 1965/U140]|jgi:anti-anti-sigma factor|nr:anti-sigma factor antagonist [Tildeniella nuda ZEHNDER 1965/U140]
MSLTAVLDTTTADTAKITLVGELDASTAPIFKEEVEKVASLNVKRLVLLLQDLEYMASAGLRVLIYAKQKIGLDTDLYVVGAQETVLDTLTKTGFVNSVFVVDDESAIETT